MSPLEQAIQNGDANQVRNTAISYLRTHRDWYNWYSEFYKWVWNGATLLIILLSALTAIIASGTKDASPPVAWAQWSLIILPAVATFLGALIAQFRVRDLWQIREAGRIKAEELVCSGLGIDVSDPKVAVAEALRLRGLAHQLEREQATGFFAEFVEGAKAKADDNPKEP